MELPKETGVFFDPELQLITARITGVVTSAAVAEWERALKSTLASLPDNSSFAIFVDLHGFKAGDIEIHKQFRTIVPSTLMEYGWQVGYTKLFPEEAKNITLSNTRGIQCIAAAHAHHDDTKIELYEREFSTPYERFFVDALKAETWIRNAVAAELKFQTGLQKHKLQLPLLTTPGGNYIPVNIRNDQAWVAIQFPIHNGNFLYKGKLGHQLSTEDGYKAMQLCALNVLAHIRNKPGLQKIIGLNHLEIWIRATDDWNDFPRVADGASDLFVDVLGKKGLHTRAVIGAASLPAGFSVALTCSFTIESNSV